MLNDARPGAICPAVPARRRGPTRVAARLALAAAAVALVAGCIPLNSQEQYLLDEANALRARHGAAAVESHPELVAHARQWAGVLASEGRLRHSDLSTISASWTKLGENTGRASTIEAVHDSFTSSRSHRATMVDPAFTHVGMGTARAGDGTVYAVQVYLRG